MLIETEGTDHRIRDLSMSSSQRTVWTILIVLVLSGHLELHAQEESSAKGLFLTGSRIPGADWPAYRRDRTLSGFSPLCGDLREAPHSNWRVDLGGTNRLLETVLLNDVNGDGQDELLRILPGQIICQNIHGKPLWTTDNLPQPKVTAIRDFAGDGTRGLLVDTYTGVEHAQYLISGLTGHATLLYKSRNVFGRYQRFGKLLKNVNGEQLCAWWSGDPVTTFGSDGMRGLGYLWSFENGLEKPHVRFQVEEVGTIYAPLHLFADMNRDNRTDLVMLSHEQVWVYDLASGEKLMQSSWGPQIRTYWAATAAEPLRPEEPPALLMINPMIPGVQVITQDGLQTTRSWKQVVGSVEDQYQSKVKINRGAPDPFVDLDGDGELEILTSVTNEHGDQRDHLVIFSSLDGVRLYDEPDQSVLTVDNLDGQGPPEIILKSGEHSLTICNWNGKTLVPRWQADQVETLIKPAPPEGHLSRAVGARSTGINMPLWRETPDSRAFLMRFTDGVFSCLLEGTKVRRKAEIDRHRALGNMKPDRATTQGYTWNGESLSVKQKDTSIVTYRAPRRQSYAPNPPIVGTIDGNQHIVIRKHSGALIRIDPDGTNPFVLIPQSPAAQGTCLVDLDGDGNHELLAVSSTGIGQHEVVAVNRDGQCQLRIVPPDGASEVALGPTGSLGTGKGSWFVVRYRIPSENTRVVAYSGTRGNVLWTRDFLGSHRTSSTTFVLHLPTAVYDVDGDGADDLIASSENWYEVISVKDNRSLTPSRAITAAVPGHWGAYATPIVADFHANRQPLVFHNNAYALTLLTRFDGSPVWHYGLTRDTTHASRAGLADLDGNLTVELVTTQKDGLVRAFDPSPINQKCPTCPPHELLSGSNHSAHVRWTFKLPPPISDFASLDIDSNGQTDLLCGAGDGSLYAITESEGSASVLWSVNLGIPVGSPVIADLNGDLKPDILVTTTDGYLHCLSGTSAP